MVLSAVNGEATITAAALLAIVKVCGPDGHGIDPVPQGLWPPPVAVKDDAGAVGVADGVAIT